MIEPAHKHVSVKRQCQLLGLSRSSYYYRPKPVSQETLEIMKHIDRKFLKTPVYGKRSMRHHLPTLTVSKWNSFDFSVINSVLLSSDWTIECLPLRLHRVSSLVRP